RSPFQVLTVRTRRIGRPRSPAERRDAERAISCLRFGLESRDPQVVEGVQRLMHGLDGDGPLPCRALDASGLGLSFAEELWRRVATEFERGRLVAEFEDLRQLSEHDEATEIELPPLPPAKPDEL